MQIIYVIIYIYIKCNKYLIYYIKSYIIEIKFDTISIVLNDKSSKYNYISLYIYVKM